MKKLSNSINVQPTSEHKNSQSVPTKYIKKKALNWEMTATQITTKVFVTLLQEPEFIDVTVPTDCLYKFNKTILPRPYLLASGE
jgi:hypothetical protein